MKLTIENKNRFYTKESLLRDMQRVTEEVNREYGSGSLMNQDELMQMLTMCATDDSDDYYEAPSVKFLAQSALAFIRRLEDKIMRLEAGKKVESQRFDW